MPKVPTKKKQSDLFIEKAREIGADDEAATDEIMKRLVAQPKTQRKPLKTKKAAK